jgi:hypothetical protein
LQDTDSVTRDYRKWGGFYSQTPFPPIGKIDCSQRKESIGVLGLNERIESTGGFYAKTPFLPIEDSAQSVGMVESMQLGQLCGLRLSECKNIQSGLLNEL